MPRDTRTKWRDPAGPHIRIYHSLVKTAAWAALSGSAVRLFIEMRTKLNSTNNGNIEAVYSVLRHRGWHSKTTLHKAIRELETLGFIAKTRQGGIASMSRVCSLYRFADLDAYEHPKLGVSACNATHDYQRFNSIKEARRSVRDAEQSRKAPAKTKVREVDVKGTVSDAMSTTH